MALINPERKMIHISVSYKYDNLRHLIDIVINPNKLSMTHAKAN